MIVDKMYTTLHTCEYSTNIPIYLILFPNPFTNRRSPFLFVNITSFFWQRLLFCFFVFTGCFNLKFIFYLFRFNLIFVSFCIFFFFIFSWPCCSFILYSGSRFSDFSPRWFVRLSNLRTFKNSQFLCYASSPFYQSITSLKKITWIP